MRPRNHKGLLITYVLVSIITMIAAWKNWNAVLYIFNPMMMLSLGIWFFMNTRAFGDRFTLLIQAGLFFSLIGDCSLMFMDLDEFAFVIGLAMFLIAHLCYLVGFSLNIADGAAPWQSLILPGIIVIGVFAFAYWYSGVLMPRVDNDISMLVGTFLILITLMTGAAAFRYQRTFKRSWILVLLGAIFFMASDSLLARDRFIDPITNGDLYITGSYAIAQALIALGCVWHVRSPSHMRKREVLQA